MTEKHARHGSLLALTPLLVFLATYLAASLITGDFYRMPISVAFLAAAVYAVATTRRLPFAERIEHFSAGAYSYGWLEALETYHRKWAGRLPLGVEPLDGARLADLDRRAEAYFLKLLCQKRLFGACPFRRIVRYIRAYPGRAASWALPFKYLKYHLKSLVRHG